jgi:YidC/Oxa1 family membrane protein insertase
VTWEFLSPLYTAVSWIIVQFHSLYSHVFNPNGGWAWGLAIASMVIVIRICLIPLFVKQIKSTRAMQAIQPKMKAIQERYKNDRQRQSEEMMKLYKEAGTNPFSSCLPILVQMPFFTALYGVLSSVAHNKPIGASRVTCWRARSRRTSSAPRSRPPSWAARRPASRSSPR